MSFRKSFFIPDDGLIRWHIKHPKLEGPPCMSPVSTWHRLHLWVLGMPVGLPTGGQKTSVSIIDSQPILSSLT